LETRGGNEWNVDVNEIENYIRKNTIEKNTIRKYDRV